MGSRGAISGLIEVEASDELCGGAASGAEGVQGQSVMPLGQADAVVVPQERAVEVDRCGQAESALQQDLAGGGAQQVGSADDFGDAKGGIIDDGGELVAGDAVARPEQEVAETALRGEGLQAEVGVGEGRGCGGSGMRKRQVMLRACASPTPISEDEMGAPVEGRHRPG